MENVINIPIVFLAGLMSVLSPCVLPVIPIIVTGSSHDHRFRPLLTVAGLSLTFISMGVLTSLFGAIIGPSMLAVEKIAAILIFTFGLLLILNINLFKHLHFLSRLSHPGSGRGSGFVLGAVLGIIWIPCVGPLLSGVLALVASEGTMRSGIILLAVYSIGFAVPLLIAGYTSHFFRQKFRHVSRFPQIINAVSGLLLMALGAFIFVRGMVGFGF